MAYRQTPVVQARRHEARIKILQAAQDCVAASGFSGSHMIGIARCAGVATGTLYNHFPSKNALFTELFHRISGHELALARVAIAGNGPVARRLERSLGEWCRRAIDSGPLAYALLVEPVDVAVAAERLEFRRAYTRLYAGLIDEGIAAGEFPSQNSDVAAAGLIGALAEILVRPLAGDGPAVSGDTETLIGDILAFCLSGIRQQATAHSVGAMA